MVINPVYLVATLKMNGPLLSNAKMMRSGLEMLSL